MSWLLLIVAGVLEAGWVIGIRQSDTFTYFPAVVFAAICMLLSLVLFAFAVRDIPIEQAYLVWLALGACTLVLANHALFGAAITLQQGIFLSLIFIGVLGLKLSES